MYRIYHTDGLVLGSLASGEASKIFSLFTKELGLIRARAQGVRETHSKLRYSLQDYFLASFDLVRGENGWRITSAIGEENLAAFSSEKRKQALAVLKRVTTLLARLFRGEEKDAVLFETLVYSFRKLKDETLPLGAIKDFEALLVMRVLHRLGYWGDDPVLSPFLAISAPEEPNLFASFSPFRTRAIRRINQSLKATQM